MRVPSRIPLCLLALTRTGMAQQPVRALQANFTGKGAEVPRDAGSAQAVVNLVGLIPGAISFARVSPVNARVKVIRIDGLAP